MALAAIFAIDVVGCYAVDCVCFSLSFECFQIFPIFFTLPLLSTCCYIVPATPSFGTAAEEEFVFAAVAALFVVFSLMIAALPYGAAAASLLFQGMFYLTCVCDCGESNFVGKLTARDMLAW